MLFLNKKYVFLVGYIFKFFKFKIKNLKAKGQLISKGGVGISFFIYIKTTGSALVETEIMGVARSVGFPLMHWRISASRSSEKVRKKH